MTRLSGTVASLYTGIDGQLEKAEKSSISAELDGIVGDRHQSFEREAYAGDKQPAGTRRRNERQWSAVSLEELAAICTDMGLDRALDAGDLGANLCLAGIDQLSRLPKGSTLTFPSGAVLVVEEYNPPCRDQGERLADKYRLESGERPSVTAFSKAAKLKRGIVGVVDVPGDIHTGDTVEIEVYDTPTWLRRSADS